MYTCVDVSTNIVIDSTRNYDFYIIYFSMILINYYFFYIYFINLPVNLFVQIHLFLYAVYHQKLNFNLYRYYFP